MGAAWVWVVLVLGAGAGAEYRLGLGRADITGEKFNQFARLDPIISNLCLIFTFSSEGRNV